VVGKFPPAMVKPVPVTPTEFTVTGEVPVEDSVIGSPVGEFTVTLPKLRLVVLTERVGIGIAAPIPLNDTTVFPLVESLATVSWPPAVPLVVGSNCTRSVRVCEGFSVTGKVPPTNVKPEPVIAAELTVTGVVPVEVSVIGNVVGEFRVTLPKTRFEVLAAIDGFANGVAAIPVPARATTALVLLEELLLIVSCPLDTPLAVGLNCICRVVVCEGFSVIGKLPPTSVNPVPLIVAEVIVTGETPVEVSVRVCICIELTAMLPKLRLLELNERSLPFAPCPCILS